MDVKTKQKQKQKSKTPPVIAQPFSGGERTNIERSEATHWKSHSPRGQNKLRALLI